MGEVYQKMERDLTIRDYSKNTRKNYLSYCSKFVQHYMRAPNKMGVSEIENFLYELCKQGAGPAKRKMYVAAIKFLYEVTLDRPEVAQKIPWPGVPKKQPDILSGSEVENLLRAIEQLMYRMVIVTAYSAGMRVSEACGLLVTDIDSRRGLIHIRNGKRRKDRFVMLSQRLLEMLRQYWRITKPKGPYLFPGQNAGTPISQETVRNLNSRPILYTTPRPLAGVFRFGGQLVEVKAQIWLHFWHIDAVGLREKRHACIEIR